MICKGSPMRHPLLVRLFNATNSTYDKPIDANIWNFILYIDMRFTNGLEMQQYSGSFLPSSCLQPGRTTSAAKTKSCSTIQWQARSPANPSAFVCCCPEPMLPIPVFAHLKTHHSSWCSLTPGISDALPKQMAGAWGSPVSLQGCIFRLPCHQELVYLNSTG